SRLDEIQAAILRVKLKHLDYWNNKRRENAKIYSELLSKLKKFIVLPDHSKNSEHVFHLYVIRSPHRDELLSFLHSRHIMAGIHYPTPVHKQPSYKNFGTPHLPNTEKICNEIISLPLYPELSYGEIESVVSSMVEFFDKRN
ncbi:MAG: DegT/DnrJ/EryC1/StrS family aminotransferase, partial [Acidobacteriota bacterium]